MFVAWSVTVDPSLNQPLFMLVGSMSCQIQRNSILEATRSDTLRMTHPFLVCCFLHIVLYCVYIHPILYIVRMPLGPYYEAFLKHLIIRSGPFHFGCNYRQLLLHSSDRSLFVYSFLFFKPSLLSNFTLCNEGEF